MFSDRLNSATPQRSNVLYRKYDQSTLTSIRSYADSWTSEQEVLPVIDWQLTGEIKELEGLTLHKAKGTFKGRNYIAWYCKDIPVPVGPWKLYGLPGLIIEAYDDTKEIEFHMVELEIPLKKDFTIAIPEPNGKMISKEEFDKQVRNYNTP